MKLGTRIAIFLVGLGALFLAWHKNHMAAAVAPNSPGINLSNSYEVLIVIGAFVMLMAFAPSPDVLGRWMSLKKPKKAHAAHFKRRRG